MTVDKQPRARALYLADVLTAGFECDQEWYEIESAKELRRLHAETTNQQDCIVRLRRLHAANAHYGTTIDHLARENAHYGATIDYLARENAEQIGEIVVLKEQRDDLLEALIDMVDYYGTASANVQQLDAAKSAIAKATGETK